MVCTHLKQFYQLCESNQLRLGGSDLIRIVCRQCDETETCPSLLMDQYDEQQPNESPPEGSSASEPKPEPKP